MEAEDDNDLGEDTVRGFELKKPPKAKQKRIFMNKRDTEKLP